MRVVRFYAPGDLRVEVGELTGGRGADVIVVANVVHYREVGIVGANGSSPAHNQQALELIAAGAVPVADLITHRLPLERTVEGIHTLARGEAIKVTVEPTGASAGRSR
jgi:L-iditol 2-dehydrogenase